MGIEHMKKLKEGRWEGEAFLLNDKKNSLLLAHVFALHFEEYYPTMLILSSIRKEQIPEWY